MPTQIAVKMVPLAQASGITIHKSQGATLDRGCPLTGDVERQLGLLFAGISRFRKLEDVCLIRPLNGDRLLKITNHKALPLRKALDTRIASLEAALDAALDVNLSEWLREPSHRMSAT